QRDRRAPGDAPRLYRSLSRVEGDFRGANQGGPGRGGRSRTRTTRSAASADQPAAPSAHLPPAASCSAQVPSRASLISIDKRLFPRKKGGAFYDARPFSLAEGEGFEPSVGR